ncbi:MAG: hypothetical protein OEW17_07775 [Gemmatimonadota bacterium]|nr:hypothetical protein [Gemmatimonadota bacterium]
MTRRPFALAAILTLMVPSCSSDPTGPSYDPDLPTSWASAVTNLYFPLVPGTVYQYESQTPEGLETITVEVMPQTRQIQGVTATVVRDRVFLDGDLIEDTYDWFAQDSGGTVWYLGEDSKEIENGQVISTEGSWEWGVDGALPGIQMHADPAAHLDEPYRQEFYRGVAEDFGKVIMLGQSATVPAGSFTGCVVTEDWAALEPGQSHENKIYCPGVGLVEAFHLGAGEPHEQLVGKSP